MSVSRIQIAGQVGSAPEKRFTPNNTAVVTFALLIPASGRANATDEPASVPVTCWGRLAESVSESLQPGQSILVDGRLQLDTLQTPDGTPKKAFAIEATTVYRTTGPVELIGGGAGPGNAENGPARSAAGYNNARPAAPSVPVQATVAAHTVMPAAQPVAVAAAPVYNTAPAQTHMMPDMDLTEDDIPF